MVFLVYATAAAAVLAVFINPIPVILIGALVVFALLTDALTYYL